MDDFGSPLGIMGIASMFVSVLVMLLFMALWGGVILYVLARWRQHRSEVDDNQFGLKFALHMFRYLGFQLMLLGGFVLLYSLLTTSGSSGRSSGTRAAMGFLVSGGVLFGVHTMVLSSISNQARFPLVGRMFAGLSLLTTGLIGALALIAVTQMLFAKGSSGDAGRIGWSLFLVYGVAWGLQGLLYVSRYAPADPGAGGSFTPLSSSTPPAAPAPTVPEPMRQPLAPGDDGPK